MDRFSTPGATGGSRRGVLQGRHTQCDLKWRLPPYARELSRSPQNSLIVLTGRGAWDRAKTPGWFEHHRLVLPFGESPSAFDWSPAKRFPDAIIWAEGAPEPDEVIKSLAQELLRHVGLVLHCGPGPLIRFRARRVVQ